ncbi:MAG: hypothetical protein QM582_06820 [Micropruina sp.]|uniref:hypothetical protein n=1 Tax=Micropruina sp. TaxID=2737536 RepID=UPI0039E696CA
MPVAALALADLALLLVAAGLGLTALLGWLRHRGSGRLPAAKIAAHLSLQLIGIATWVAFLVTGAAAVAWVAFAVLTVGQVFGDLLMFVSYRARYPGTARPHYLAVGGDVLSFRRPAPALHALVGALAWFSMLAICIAATVAG